MLCAEEQLANVVASAYKHFAVGKFSRPADGERTNMNQSSIVVDHMTTDYALPPRNKCEPVEIIGGVLPVVFRVELLEPENAGQVEIELYGEQRAKEPTDTVTIGRRGGQTVWHYRACRAVMRTHADNFGARLRVTIQGG